jgi:hypothetical protein
LTGAKEMTDREKTEALCGAIVLAADIIAFAIKKDDGQEYPEESDAMFSAFALVESAMGEDAGEHPTGPNIRLENSTT